MTYIVRFSDGSTATADDYLSAKIAVYERFTGAVIGHDGDLDGFGDRTLCWRNEAESLDDDGARAVASIWRGTE